MVLRSGLLTLVAVSVAASPAIAQTSSTPAATPSAPVKKTKDPNEIVCERQEELGTRLSSAKICHTRAEWAELRAQDRQMVDKAQISPTAPAGH